MFKYSSKANLRIIFLGLAVCLLGFIPTAQAQFMAGKEAVVDSIYDDQYLIAISETDDWEIGEILPIKSQNAKVGVFAFVELAKIRPLENKKFELKLRLLRQSRKYFIQKGDELKRLDLTAYNEDFIGTTDLIVKASQMNISSRFRPLFYQGFAIGETAQSLYKNEFLVNYFGNLYYGVTDWLSLGSLVPVNLLGRPNATIKAKFWDTESTTLAAGLSFVRLVKEDQATLNLNLYWDSTSSDSLLSHTFLSLGLIKWDGAADAAAIKSLGSSSFQTGYEIITPSWDRVLIGPSYNFEKKALGGYLSYIWVFDRFHMQLSMNATDITSFRLDPTDGYYGFFDVYWRF